MPVGGSGSYRFYFVFPGPVAYEPFQFTDGNGFAFQSQDASAFALAFLGAYPAAYRRQEGVLGNDACCFREISLIHLSDELRNLQRDRAVFDTSRLFAVDTPGGFQTRFFHVVSVTYFFKIGYPYFRVLFPYGYTGYFVGHILILGFGAAGKMLQS